jgi:hypothetical protein
MQQKAGQRAVPGSHVQDLDRKSFVTGNGLGQQAELFLSLRLLSVLFFGPPGNVFRGAPIVGMIVVMTMICVLLMVMR